jgi:Uma2 family endonuclease
MGPSINHSYIQVKLASLLNNLTQYSVFSELTLDIDGKEYVPDLCIYPQRKFDPLNDLIRIKEIPLLILEILSPTQLI